MLPSRPLYHCTGRAGRQSLRASWRRTRCRCPGGTGKCRAISPGSPALWPHGVAVITSALHAEGRQFDPGCGHTLFWHLFFCGAAAAPWHTCTCCCLSPPIVRCAIQPKFWLPLPLLSGLKSSCLRSFTPGLVS